MGIGTVNGVFVQELMFPLFSTLVCLFIFVLSSCGFFSVGFPKVRLRYYLVKIVTYTACRVLWYIVDVRYYSESVNSFLIGKRNVLLLC